MHVRQIDFLPDRLHLLPRVRLRKMLPHSRREQVIPLFISHRHPLLRMIHAYTNSCPKTDSYQFIYPLVLSPDEQFFWHLRSTASVALFPVFRIFQLDLRGNQLMLQIIEFLFFPLQFFLQNGNLLLALK